MVIYLKRDNYIIKGVITFIIIFCIYIYKIYLRKDDYKFVFDKVDLKYNEMYNNLKDNYDLVKESVSSFIYAEIVNLSLSKINNLVLINKGSLDGVKEESFVVNKDGLIGIVKKVYNNSSVIRLITSNNTAIAVETSECFGTLKVKNNEYIIDDLINCEDIKVNDPVFTSKYNYSSSNILVGTIKEIKSGKLYVKVALNPYKLRFVGVISDNN